VRVKKMRKIAAIVLTAIIAISAFSIVASASAMPFMNWRNNMMGPGNHRGITQQSFVRMDGVITQWGDTPVKGGIQAQSRTVIVNATNVRQGSIATVLWTSNDSRPISALRSRENFTYTFYAARLTNVNVSSLNETGYIFFLNGTWNVWKVTSTFTITTDSSGNITNVNRDQNTVPLVTGAYGELKIASSSNKFTLAITGIDSLTGTVRVQRMTTRMFNPFIVNNTDGQTTVTPADVATIANCYGSSPGFGNYGQNMDYNFNFKVDICDLTTAAANING
jgi:hypothetical protein